MKIDLTKILLAILLLISVYSNFFKKSENKVIENKYITTPKISGTSGKTVLKEYIPYKVEVDKEVLFVDETWRDLYNSSIDSIQKYKLYLQSIKINNYNKSLIENDTISINGQFTTRGELLDYNVDYTIKSFEISYTPDVIKELPRLSLGLGFELGLPTNLDTPFTVKPNLSLGNKKGHEINFSFDTNKTYWLGYTKNFKIIK